MYEIFKDWTSDEATNALPFLDRTFIYVSSNRKQSRGSAPPSCAKWQKDGHGVSSETRVRELSVRYPVVRSVHGERSNRS